MSHSRTSSLALDIMSPWSSRANKDKGKDKGKGKAINDGEDDEEDLDLEFEQFPAPFISGMSTSSFKLMF